MDEQRRTLDALEESDMKMWQVAAALGDALLASDSEAARAAVKKALPDWNILGQPIHEPEKWRPFLGQMIAKREATKKAPPSRS